MSRFSQLGNDLFSGKTSYPIVPRRRLWYVVAGVLIALSLVGLLGKGLNFGIEFRGGSELRVSQVQDLDSYEQRADAVMNEVAPGGTHSVTRIGDSTVRVQTGELSNQDAETARLDLADEFDVASEDVTSSFVGPSWGETVTQRAFIALAVFLLLVTVVLTFYFQTWKMAAAAMVALIHDVVFTIGVYALLGIEVSPASVIGFLTILGYSIYDTIVVFDKVRENTEHAMDTKRQTFGEAANLAVNQTLVRSINTSVVALLPVGVILLVGITLVGPGTLVDLSWALFIGIAVGTFSSIFIATPLLVTMRQGEVGIRKHDAQVTRRRQRQEARTGRSGGSEPDVDLLGGEELGPEDREDLGDVHDGEDGPQVAAGATAVVRPASGDQPATGRQLHPYAQRGPRNQPKRKRRS